MANSIHIRNPKVIQIVEEEQIHDIGRNPTETAGNLIAEAATARKLAREQSAPIHDQEPRSVAASVPAQ